MSSSYILTLFDDNLINGVWESLHDTIFEDGKAVYLGSQLERCPTTKRIHWQAFIKFHRQSKQRGSYFKRFDNRIHFEVCSRERSNAIGYGTKEETRVEGPRESGLKPSPVTGKTDFSAVRDAIEKGEKDQIPFDVVVRYNLERRYEGLRTFLAKDIRADIPAFLENPWGLVLPSRKVCKMRHYWIWSERPNLGKTYYFARPLSEKYKVRILTGDFTYFNVQDTDQCIIFDEFNTAKLRFDSINQICDGTFAWRRCGQTSVVLRDPLIIILSNVPISVLYPHMHYLIEARMKCIELK